MNKDLPHTRYPSVGEQHQNSKFWRRATVGALILATALLGDVINNPDGVVAGAVADSTSSILKQLGVEITHSIQEDIIGQTSAGNQ